MTGSEIFLTVLTSALTWCFATLLLLLLYWLLNRYFPLRPDLPNAEGIIDIDEELITLDAGDGIKRGGSWAILSDNTEVIEFDVSNEYQYPSELFVAHARRDSGRSAIVILCDGDDDPRLGGISVQEVCDFIGTGEAMDVQYVLEHPDFLGMPYGSVQVGDKHEPCIWVEIASATEATRFQGFTVWEAIAKAADHLRQMDTKESDDASTPDATV